MNKTDKQAISLLTVFALLMLASVAMPSKATNNQQIIVKQTAKPVSEVSNSFITTQQCLIGSDITLYLKRSE